MLLLQTLLAHSRSNSDGLLGTEDLMLLHASLDVCQHDVNHDGQTDIDDLLPLIEGWSTTCP